MMDHILRVISVARDADVENLKATHVDLYILIAHSSQGYKTSETQTRESRSSLDTGVGALWMQQEQRNQTLDSTGISRRASDTINQHTR